MPSPQCGPTRGVDKNLPIPRDVMSAERSSSVCYRQNPDGSYNDLGGLQ